jgi:hypothetical protein
MKIEATGHNGEAQSASGSGLDGTRHHVQHRQIDWRQGRSRLARPDIFVDIDPGSLMIGAIGGLLIGPVVGGGNFASNRRALFDRQRTETYISIDATARTQNQKVLHTELLKNLPTNFRIPGDSNSPADRSRLADYQIVHLDVAFEHAIDHDGVGQHDRAPDYDAFAHVKLVGIWNTADREVTFMPAITRRKPNPAKMVAVKSPADGGRFLTSNVRSAGAAKASGHGNRQAARRRHRVRQAPIGRAFTPRCSVNERYSHATSR